MKLLAVYDTLTKRLQGLDPAKATGVPIPAFRSGLALPRAGTTQGEAFVNVNTGEASVWDGQTWNPIAKPVVSRYPNEGVLLQDNPVDGTVAIAESTGNVFTRVAGEWRALGARTFPTVLARDASMDAPGTVAFVEQTGEWSLRIPSGFLQPEAASIGAPLSNEAALGIAVATIIAAGRAGQWLRLDPGYDYPGVAGGGTINELPLPMLGANGDWAIYDGATFIQVDGTQTAAGNPVASGNPVWALLSQQTVTVGAAPPATPVIGQQWFDTASQTLFTWDGTIWRPPSVGVPLGTIISHASVNPPAGYLLCDGSVIPAGTQFDALRAMIGNNVPDLNNYFLRGNTSQANIDGWTKRSDTTRLPRSHNFTGSTNSTGNHQHQLHTAKYDHNDRNKLGGYSSGANWGVRISDTFVADSGWTDYNGTHTHTVQITGGGDSETAPQSIYCAYHIRAIQ